MTRAEAEGLDVRVGDWFLHRTSEERHMVIQTNSAGDIWLQPSRSAPRTLAIHPTWRRGVVVFALTRLAHVWSFRRGFPVCVRVPEGM